MAKPMYKDAIMDYRSGSITKYKNNPRKTYPKQKRTNRVVKKKNLVARFVSFIFMLLVALFVIPVHFDALVRPTFLKTNKYPAIKVDYSQLYKPTSKYLSNNYFLGHRFLSPVNLKKSQMLSLYETYSINGLKSEIQDLANKFPTLQPSIYVWDYESGKYVDFNANSVYPTASIIKIPVLIQLFKYIESGVLNLNDKIKMTDYYISEGSGSLQFKGNNAEYTIDELARVMITESDNSATNILLDLTGGMNSMNRAFRHWGMKETRVNDWLPDLAGTNVSTAKEMATMIYNLDNPAFMSLNSREKMVDYMSHVHNNRLIQAGLPSNALFIHKTGDIGKMLGDAGIVYMPNGRKYIVVMFVNRPYNSSQGKEFIVSASSLIYNYMLYSNL